MSVFTNCSESCLGKKSDIWGHQDDDVGETGWDFRSDFVKLHQAGYREAVLEDYQEEEAAGRLKGFQCAFKSQPDLNSTFLLSRLDGIIMTCLTVGVSNLTDEQKTEASLLQKEIKQLLAQNYELDGNQLSRLATRDAESAVVSTQEPIAGFRVNSDSVDSAVVRGLDNLCSKAHSVTTNVHLNNIIERTRALYQNLGWVIPEFLAN